MFWKKGSPDELSAFLFRKTCYRAHLFTGNLSGVFERHYMYACAKCTKQNKQMY